LCLIKVKINYINTDKAVSSAQDVPKRPLKFTMSEPENRNRSVDSQTKKRGRLPQ